MAENTIYDIDYFDSDVPVYKVLFQDKTTILLKSVIEQICYDHSQGKTQYPSLLLVGNHSKNLIAQAFSHSLCFKYEEIQGNLLGMGGNPGSLYENLQCNTVYHIKSAGNLTNYTSSYLYQFIKQGYVRFKRPTTDEVQIVDSSGKLFIFSAGSSASINPELLKTIDYHCYLDDYTDEQLSIIVEQRL